MRRPAVTLVVPALLTLTAAAAQAQPRWVEDDAVLARGTLRFAGGGGLLLLTYPVAKERQAILGGGWNLEAAAGLGHDLELGARLGLRDAEGRAVHADQAARVLDTETFGAGLGTVANPELRLRWRVLRRGRVEAGLEDRLVFPLPSYPDVTLVLGGWAAVHAGRWLRLDLGLNLVVISRSFSTGRVLQPGLGLPVRASVNLTDGLFASLVATTHHLASTSYTAAHTTVIAGAGLGYRYRACELYAAYQRFGVLGTEVVNGTATRNGLGFVLACRVGGAQDAR